MTRPLIAHHASDVIGVWRALRAALNADGPAVMPIMDPRTDDVPREVNQRTALVVQTSGSTGKPKRVELSAAALISSATAAHSELGGPGDWLLALPVHYIAGINVLVREIVSDCDLHSMNLRAGFTVEGFVHAAENMQHPRRYTALVPAQLARLMDAPEAHDSLRRFDGILIGGQAMPRELAARAEELGLAVRRTYGSSETSGGCVWDGRPLGDTQIAIVDGQVELSGSSLAEGYLGDPERTARTFVERDGRRWYRTDDTGTLTDGVLRVTGRVDDVIISGGVKVSLAEVEAVVRGMPGQSAAVVVAAPHPEWGQSPVVVTTAEIALADLRDAVAARLGAAAAPARVIVLDSLPELASGKPDRLSIAALALR